jgi:hypothetical protein
VELREGGLAGLLTPVLLYVIHCCTPFLDLLRFPVVLVEEKLVQVLEPSLEGSVYVDFCSSVRALFSSAAVRSTDEQSFFSHLRISGPFSWNTSL